YRIARMGISRTFQTIRLFPSMTTWENVLIGQNTLSKSGIRGILPIRRAQEVELRRQAQEALKVLGLWEMRDRKAVTLPYGNQRKVEIARAIAARPKLLL
ncbi:MAG: ATP-binding cassette domain-containing protein, partial [Desulfobacterales bacterium]|nr:ATP-binding cassette domain-containing protein [Desulfobacterales bacterium]